MRHIRIQNYVEERLNQAKRRKPGILQLILIVGSALTLVGTLLFAYSLFRSVISFFQIFESFQKGDYTIGFGSGFGYFKQSFIFFIIILVGNGLVFLSMGIIGLSPRNLKNIIGVIRGDDVARWEAGLQGEQSVINTLSSLDDQWTLFSGVVLDGYKGDIDHVLVGPSGIYAIEVKNYSGTIIYSHDQATWTRYKRNSYQVDQLEDPADQVVRGSKRLGEVLHSRVVSVLVFTHPSVVIRADPYPGVEIQQVSELRKWVQSRPVLITPIEIENVVKVLETKSQSASGRQTQNAYSHRPVKEKKQTETSKAPIYISNRKPIILAVSVLAIIFLAGAGILSASGILKTQGCVIGGLVSIRSGPSTSYDVVGSADVGECFHFDAVSEDKEWLLIVGFEQYAGNWISRDYIDLDETQVNTLRVGK